MLLTTAPVSVDHTKEALCVREFFQSTPHLAETRRDGVSFASRP